MSADRAVLSDLLLGADPRQVELADFDQPAHKEIYRAVLAAHEAGERFDMATMPGRMPHATVVEAAACFEHATTTANFRFHVAALKRDRQMRELKLGALALVGALRDTDAPESVQPLLERLRERARPAAQRGPRHISETIAQYLLAGVDRPVPWGLETMAPLRVVAGELCVPAARPRHGKTALLGTIALAAAREGWQVLFYSLEMPAKQIHARLLSAVSNLTLSDVLAKRDGDVPAIKAAVETLMPLRLWIEDEGDDSPFRLDLEGITALTRLFCELNQDRPTVVLVDYLQRVRTSARYEKRYEIIGHVCRSLKDMAKACAVPVIAAAQLGRGVEQRGKRGESARPQLSDLRESGNIETDADEIVLMHPNAADRALFNVSKYRQGAEFIAEVAWDGPHCRFTDLMSAPAGDWDRY